MLVKRPKEISDKLMPYFIRGYFDGNGNYNFELKKSYMLSCCCAGRCYNLFLDFKDYLESKGIKCELKSHKSREDFYNLRIRTRPDVKKFIDLIFADHLDLILQRKYNKIKLYLENYHTTKEWQSISHIGKKSPLSNPGVHNKEMRTRKKNIALGKTKPSMLGKHHSEETKRKIGESNKRVHLAQVK